MSPRSVAGIRRLLVLWAILVAAGILAGLAVEGNGFDGPFVRSVAGERTAALTGVARPLTMLGGLWLDLVFVAAVAGLACAGHRRDAVFVLLAAGGAMLVTNAIKFVLARPRPGPPGGGLVSVSSYSWPSGHASSSIALYGALALLALPQVPPRARPALAGGLVALLAAIGATRVYLGVHYPSDVVAGWLVGGVWLLGVRRTVTALGAG